MAAPIFLNVYGVDETGMILSQHAGMPLSAALLLEFSSRRFY
jgi:hypothetical protein